MFKFDDGLKDFRRVRTILKPRDAYAHLEDCSVVHSLVNLKRARLQRLYVQWEMCSSDEIMFTMVAIGNIAAFLCITPTCYMVIPRSRFCHRSFLGTPSPTCLDSLSYAFPTYEPGLCRVQARMYGMSN